MSAWTVPRTSVRSGADSDIGRATTVPWDPIRSKVSEERRRGDRGRVRSTGRRMNERERAGATDGGVVTDNEPARARYDAELYLCVLLVRGGGARVEPEGGVVAAADGAEGARAEKARGDEARRGESHEEGHVVVVVSGAFGVVSMFTACGLRPRGSLLRRGSYRRGCRVRRDTTASSVVPMPNRSDTTRGARMVTLAWFRASCNRS